LSNWQDLGVNRLSLGVQSFDDDALKLLGRNHTGDEAARALGLLKDKFERYTFDLIYALPDQSQEQWLRDFSKALSFSPGHLSLYQLTIEPGTAFDHAVRRGTMVMPSNDSVADFFEVTVRLMEDAGYRHYEISNFSQPGHEAMHNLLYWQYQDYIAIGPGAHGRITLPDSADDQRRMAIENTAKPLDYLQLIHEHRHGCIEQLTLTSEAQMHERFAMGLRLEAGISLYQNDFFFESESRKQALGALIADGYLNFENDQLVASRSGRQLLDSLLGILFGGA